MPYHPHEITVEIAKKPAAVRRRLERLMKKHGGDTSAVAAELGVGVRSVQRYLKKLGIRKQCSRCSGSGMVDA